MPTLDEILAELSYDALTGRFTRVCSVNQREVGGDAGYLDRMGYVRIKFHHTDFRAHRLAWFFHYGQWPSRDIDHINGNKSDNRISNLREATHSQNMINKVKQKNNKSGIKGVYWNKNRCKWNAQIKINGKIKYLGLFVDINDAAHAYAIAAEQLHGDFRRVS